MDHYFAILLSSIDFMAKEESNRASSMHTKRSTTFDDFLNEIYQNKVKKDSRQGSRKSSTDFKNIFEYENNLSAIVELSNENVSVEHSNTSKPKRKSSHVSFGRPSIMNYVPEANDTNKGSSSSSSSSPTFICSNSVTKISEDNNTSLATPSFMKYSPETPEKDTDTSSQSTGSITQLRESLVNFSTPTVLKFIPENLLRESNENYSKLTSTIAYDKSDIECAKDSLLPTDVSDIPASRRTSMYETPRSSITTRSKSRQNSHLNLTETETPKVLSSTRISSTAKNTIRRKRGRRKATK